MSVVPPATSKMLRKPCDLSSAASRFTSSSDSVTRKIGLSREKPQEEQLLTHSLERYRGANMRMVLPNRCCLIVCALRPIVSSSSPAAGEISVAKSAREILDLPSVSCAATEPVATDFLTSASSGRELNSATKLTAALYQISTRSRATAIHDMLNLVAAVLRHRCAPPQRRTHPLKLGRGARSRVPLFPDVAEHDHAERGGERDGKNAAENAAEQRRSCHHRDDDDERMQTHAVAHDFGRDDEAFKRLHHGEHGEHQGGMLPVAVLHERQRERGNANHNRAEKRNHREKHRRKAKQKRVVHTDDEKAGRVKHRIANRHQNLPAKKCDEILLDGIEDKNHFLLRARILQWQIIFPASFDVVFLQQKIKRINGNQHQSRQQAEAGGDFGDADQQP